MRVLCTGGAGFIGSHVVDALLLSGHEVLVLDNLSTGKRSNVNQRAAFVEGDIRDGALLDRVFAEFLPQAVAHQAAQTSVPISTREPLRDAEINVLGSLQVLQACVKHKVARLVFASTGGAIYGEVPDEKRASIDWVAQPLSAYGCSKLAVESYLRMYTREHGLCSTVLRYANVYGPRQDPHGEAGVVAIFAQRILRGQPIAINARKQTGDDGCVRDYVFVADVVRANLLAVEGKLLPSPLNVCTGEPTTTLRLARLLERAAGAAAAITHHPRRPGDLERSVLDPGPGNPLGSMVSLEEGITRTLSWFKEMERVGA
jgi:UDP-glucose 4-epimerase